MINQFKTTEIFKSIKRLNVHQLFEFAEEDDVDIFRLSYDHNGVNITMIIALDDSDWLLVRYYIAECHNPVKKEQLLELLNELNKIRRTKYFIDNDNNIVSEIQFIASEDWFDADRVIQTAIMFLKGLEQNDYSKIMRVLWS